MINFINSIKDTFPYVESAIVILDNNLTWWKKNFKKLEEDIANVAAKFSDRELDVRIRFTMYHGPDENVESVTWNGPAIEFDFVEGSTTLPSDIKNELGNTWNGHKLITDDNKLIALFE